MLRAGSGEETQARLASEQLLRLYLKPLQTFLVRARGIDPVEAEDLLNGFVADKLLEKALIAAADPQKGKFRTFLLHALDRYLTDRYRHSSRQRRSAGMRSISLDGVKPADWSSEPQRQFEVEWARQVVARALEHMHVECDAGGRTDVWAVFDGRIIGPTLHARQPTSYSELVEHLRLESTDQASNLLVTAKRMFHRALRQIISEYARDESEIDQEIVELEEILSGTSRR